MDKVILTDVDGVILDWEAGFHEWMEDAGHRPVEGHEDMHGMHLRFDMERSTAHNMVRQFNESAAIGFLRPLRDAVQGMQELASMGYRFEIITALGLNRHAQTLRYQNLSYVLGPAVKFHVYYVDTAAPKTEILNEMGQRYPGHWWIEDSPQNARDGIRAGLRSILIRHPFNEGYKMKCPRVYGWDEIVNLVKIDEEHKETASA
jgi:FMN phosphatase YigB (HAD superfamily)